MSLHYILDGYNITKQNDALSRQKLEAQRDALEALLNSQRPQGSANNRVTVVYDGVAGLFSDVRQSGGIKTVFSQNESADDMIKRMVDRAQRKNDVVVVTDDRSLRYYVRALGARVLGVKAFMSQVARVDASDPQRGSTLRRGQAGKHIPKTLESEINQELRRVWAKKEKNR